MSTPDISKEYSVSSSTIARWLIASEIPIRSPSEAHLIGKHRPDNESLYRMYVEEGMTTTSIADVCGVCAHTVWLWLITCGISPRSGSDAHMVGKHKPTADELNWMYTTDNLSTHEIGRMVGVDSGTIGRWLKEYGIYVRSVSESLMGKWVGEISPTWKGVSRNYCHKFNESFKESIREEFGRVCFICGKTEEENGRKLDVHHVSYQKECLCAVTNCRFVPLCKACHGRTNGDRFFWYSLIMCRLLAESSTKFFSSESYIL
jgi:transposase